MCYIFLKYVRLIHILQLDHILLVKVIGKLFANSRRQLFLSLNLILPKVGVKVHFMLFYFLHNWCFIRNIFLGLKAIFQRFCRQLSFQLLDLELVIVFGFGVEFLANLVNKCLIHISRNQFSIHFFGQNATTLSRAVFHHNLVRLFR